VTPLLVPKTTINLLDIPFFKNVLAHNQITSPMGRPMISLPNNHWLGFDLLNIESCSEFLEIMIIERWGKSPVDFDLRQAIRRTPIWYKYAEGTAEAYISARLKANTWTAYQYAWDAIATAAASSNIRSWTQFEKEKNFVMSKLATDRNLKAIVRNDIKATLAIVVDLITKEEEVVNALLKHLKTPVAQLPKRKYEEEQWARLEPIWD
jgi:hypothetical protein